jgi:hypothetical protein
VSEGVKARMVEKERERKKDGRKEGREGVRRYE